jgi:bifunctional N-acetylglucosamine-1-phosphate-uridyltransferase/glucosamine-1-phosphate-acetyltransferase GlmU-like protein
LLTWQKIEEIMEESDSDDEKKVAKTEMTGIIEKDRMKLNQKLRRLYRYQS